MQNPFLKFKTRWKKAQKKKDPTADYISLATVDGKGKPRVRTVLLKTLDKKGIGFVTQSLGPKIKSLKKKSSVECCMVWPSLTMQVRFSGDVHPMPKSALKKLWKHRPREAQLLYHLGIPQSSPIPSFDYLVKKVSALGKAWADKKNIPLSPYYIGFVVDVKEIEFFYHHFARLNRREHYRKTSRGWVRNLLAP